MNGSRANSDGDELAKTSWPRAILHVDMDAFYVNVHRLDHPEDTHIPLVVGGQPNQRGVVASASYEARKFGVRSAMPTNTALRLCPGLKIVSADWSRIHHCSRQVMEILAAYGPLEQMSVDEAYIDLSQWPSPQRIAPQVRLEVKEKTHLPCSIGLATSKLVAKVASEFEKPEGCTIVAPGDEASFLEPLPTRVLWGIGPRTAERLEEMGISTCGQLAMADKALLRDRFGRQAESLQRRARGEDRREVEAQRGLAKSISQEWTFSRDVDDPRQLESQLEKMATKVAGSLRKRNLVAYTVTVKFRWADFTTFTRQKTLEVGTDDGDAIAHIAISIWKKHWPEGQPMRLIGVGVSKLEAVEGRQLGFGF
jgi:DNA polymerase-4